MSTHHGNDCQLCQGLGGIAPHVKWSAQRGKPLWTAHEYPSDDPHLTLPCPYLLAAHPAEPAPVASQEQIVADFIAQREEYVRVLKQCVNADADYHRWQGHAEARRQLRDKLLKAGESNG